MGVKSGNDNTDCWGMCEEISSERRIKAISWNEEESDHASLVKYPEIKPAAEDREG